MTEFEGKKTAVALGNFDGLHKGHLAVINEAVIQKSNGLLPCIVTFEEHPQKAIFGEAPKMLMSRSLYAKETEKLGCKTLRISFESVRDMSPEEFFSEILIKKLCAEFIVCGFNYRFGKNGMGNADILENLCKKYNIDFICVGGVDYCCESISSTRIRNSVENGEIEKANEMLGRFFSYDFEVVTGDRIGAKVLGFPTINQIFPEEHIIPKSGVYASATEIDGKIYASMTNIGKRPTVDGEQLRSETCIIGFSGDLYGKNIPVKLISYMRDEKKFESLELLSEQLKYDCEKSKKIFNEVFR